MNDSLIRWWCVFSAGFTSCSPDSLIRSNPTPGILINRPNGTDVYKGVPKDYIGEVSANIRAPEHMFALTDCMHFLICCSPAGCHPTELPSRAEGRLRQRERRIWKSAEEASVMENRETFKKILFTCLNNSPSRNILMQTHTIHVFLPTVVSVYSARITAVSILHTGGCEWSWQVPLKVMKHI